MYNNPFYNQPIDRINNQIAELERLKSQIPPQQPTNLTQNFQLAPTNRDVIKYANSIDEVQREMVVGETPYFSKDMSVVWIKNTKNEIKTYELTEIIAKDEKDIQIALLQSQIEDLKKEMKRYEQFTSYDDEPENATNTEEFDEPVRTTIKKNQSTGISRVSRSKEK